ncbi:MAG: amidohydrolase family protein [Kangiellaceae bacterium]|nr:amidohydrolase family protein [Kangiellaceae bacterium]
MTKTSLKIFSIVAILIFLMSSFLQAAEKKEDEDNKWDVNNPPGERYQANIDVTEGTWMNVDVSPDGKTVLFDLLGDLYTIPIKGGDATPLTHSIAWEMQAKFSPDGKRIVFTSDQGGGDNIWVMDIDGSNQKQITKEKFRLLNSPSWSPDGQYIAARKHFTSRRSIGAGEIWLYHIAGGNGLQMNEKPNDQKDLGEPIFSPDGKKVYFSRDSTPGGIFEYSKDSNQIIYEIFSIDRTNGKIKKEISGMGGSVRPTPSPDGNKIAFVRRIRNQSSIFIQNVATGISNPVFEKLDRDMQETWAIHGVYPSMAWTPDNRSLVFWAGGKLRQLDTKTQSVREIPFHIKTTKEMRKAVRFEVNPGADSFKTKMLRWVKVSPNGKLVVFQALGQLYVRNLTSGKTKQITKNKNEFSFYPSFSRDSKKIVYASWNDKNQGAIKTIAVSGGRSKQLTKVPGKYIEPSFSADGKRVVFEKVTHGRVLSPDHDINPGVYIVSSKGGQPKLVTDDGENPSFSVNDNRIFVTRFADKKTKLVSVNFDGLDPIAHASSQWATEFTLSPDEKLLAFAEKYQLYLVPFTYAAKAIDLSASSTNLPLLKLTSVGGNYLSWSHTNNKVSKQQINWSLGSQLHQQTIGDINLWNSKDEDKEKTIATTKITELGFTVDSDIPDGSTLLTGAKIITLHGDEVIEQGDILIKDNKIAAIGKSDSFSLPNNTKIISLEGKTIIPGLVDVHWHGSQGSSQIIPRQNWMNLASLAFGVTTIHDPSNDTGEIFASAEMAKKGLTTAPRIFSTGRILYGAKAQITAEIDSLKDAVNHLNRLKKQGAFSVKSYNQPRRDQRQQILEAARQTKMMVVPEGGSLLQHNLTMIVDGHTGIEHSIPAAAVYDDVIQLWSQSETGYTPTLVVSYGGIWGEHYWYQHTEVWKHELLSQWVPKDILNPRSIRRTIAPEEDYNHFNSANVAKQLQDAGVSIQLGAHGQREGLGAHWEIWMFSQGGMTPLEALRAATLDGAKYIGMDKYIGSLEVGKLADLVVLDVDPLQDIYQSDKVNMVMINGRLFDSKTMNEIGNHPKKRQKLFFQK